jgi:CBS domain-containing protein
MPASTSGTRDRLVPPRVRQAVSAVMRRHWIETTTEMTLVELERMMRLARVRQVPVVEGGILRGTIAHADLLHAAVNRALGRNGAGRRGRALRVSDVLVANPPTASPDEPITSAVDRMIAAQVGCLPVVEPSADGPRLVGILVESDLLRLVYAPLAGS